MSDMDLDAHGDTETDPITPEGLRQLRILLDEGASGYTRQTVASLVALRDRTVVALNAATAMNGVHERTIARLREQLEQAKLAPGPTGLARVWSGYDDNEHWHPFFAGQADAKAYAEAAFRASCAELETDEPGEITWKERAARTDRTGYPDMFDLQSEVGGDGWVLCGVLVHPDLASGLRAAPIETAKDDEPEPQIPGQGELPVAVPTVPGFRIGDLVEITGRGDIFDGKTGVVAKVDDDPEYPLGLTVEGFVGPVWCNSGEIRHAAEGAVRVQDGPQRAQDGPEGASADAEPSDAPSAPQRAAEGVGSYRCPTSCDPDCEHRCHEGHQVRAKQTHDVDECRARNAAAGAYRRVLASGVKARAAGWDGVE